MKTIEEAAKDYAIKILNFQEGENPDDWKLLIDNCAKNFISGIEFAQRWIPVEEELPEDRFRILVKTHYGRMFIARRTSKYYINDDNQTIGGVTHWRPIELK